MKKILTLGTLLLGCCWMRLPRQAQDEAPQGAPPPTSPQVNSRRHRSRPFQPAEMPPDTSAAGQDQARLLLDTTRAAQATIGAGMPEPVGQTVFHAGRQPQEITVRLSGDTSYSPA